MILIFIRNIKNLHLNFNKVSYIEDYFNGVVYEQLASNIGGPRGVIFN